MNWYLPNDNLYVVTDIAFSVPYLPVAKVVKHSRYIKSNGAWKLFVIPVYGVMENNNYT